MSNVNVALGPFRVKGRNRPHFEDQIEFRKAGDDAGILINCQILSLFQNFFSTDWLMDHVGFLASLF